MQSPSSFSMQTRFAGLCMEFARCFLSFSPRQKKLASFRFRLAAKAALCNLLLPFQIKPTSLGFDLIYQSYSPSATQKPKITQKSITVRCIAVLPEQKCVQAMKSPQVILYVLARALKRHGRFSARQNRVCPCQLMVSYSEQKYKERTNEAPFYC